eukprot:m.371519 g.371519  ORF g.371519 m.371519 type:complete len:66 (+) comp58821_c0_seq1:103-300(+)
MFLTQGGVPFSRYLWNKCRHCDDVCLSPAVDLMCSLPESILAYVLRTILPSHIYSLFSTPNDSTE